MSADYTSRVSISRCARYDPEEVDRAVAEVLDHLGGLKSIVHPGQTVLLKPNLLSPKFADTAATTHPTLVGAAAKAVMKLGAKPVIGDSPPFRGQTANTYEHVLRMTGMREVADHLGVEIVSLDRPWREVGTGGKYFKKLPVAAAFLEADVVINLPKLKTHDLTAFTGAVKNMFGCIPGLKKSQLHLQAAEDRELFAQMIVDVFAACRPTISIMDAVVGMEGSGPSHGYVKQIGVILAGFDAVALDAVACEIVAIPPASVDTTRLAGEQGLGEARMERIEIVGENIERLRVTDFVPSPTVGAGMSQVPERFRGLLRNQLVPMPRVRADRCIACGDCVKVCAVKSMELVPRGGSSPDKVARADLLKCIACYCCDEACPHDAINIRAGWFGELLRRKRSYKK